MPKQKLVADSLENLQQRIANDPQVPYGVAYEIARCNTSGKWEATPAGNL
jgi:hypothetical protein